MNAAFPRRDAVLSVSAAQHPTSQAAVGRLMSEGYEVSLFGAGAQVLADQWAASGMPVGVRAENPLDSPAPAIAVLETGEASWAPSSPNLLWLGAEESMPLAGGRGIDNLETWVDDYLAPRVPRFPRLG